MEELNRSRIRLNTILAAKFISDIGNWISAVLILLFTNDLAVSKAQGISLVFCARILIPLLVAPLITKVVDRHPSGKWLVLCDLLAAVIVLLIPGSQFVALTAIIAGVLSTVTAVHFSASLRLLKAYTPKDQMKQSILKQALLEGIAILIGTSLAGLIASKWGFKWGFVVDAMSFVLSATLVAGVFLLVKGRAVPQGHNESAAASSKFIFSLKNMPWLLMVSSLTAVCLGVKDTTLIQLVINELKLSPGFYASVIALGGVGGIVGNLIAHRVALEKAYWGLIGIFVLIAMLYVAIGLKANYGALIGITFLMGVVESAYYFLRTNLFFVITPETYVARAAGVFRVFNGTARSLGVVILGMGFSFLLPSQQFLAFSVFAVIAVMVSFLLRPDDAKH